MKLFWIAPFLLCMPAFAQSAPAPQPDPLRAVRFLEGTWEAKTGPAGSAGATVSGRYVFQTELGGHILARHATSDPNCKAPASFDCAHGDLLYLFVDAPGEPLKAIYFDNEGHVLHYTVSTPTPTSAVFLTEPGPGPRFRLMYELTAGVLYGKFQMLAPGQTEWRSYLEWSGKKE